MEGERLRTGATKAVQQWVLAGQYPLLNGLLVLLC